MTVSRRRYAVPAQDVYDAVVDANRYPRWLVGARAVESVDDRWPEPGASFAHEVGGGPLTVNDVTTATGGASGRTFRLRVRARPFLEADVEFEVRSEGPTHSSLVMTETPVGRFRFVVGILGPLVKLRNDRSLVRLARELHDPTVR